jgi:hypothetical protein
MTGQYGARVHRVKALLALSDRPMLRSVHPMPAEHVELERLLREATDNVARMNETPGRRALRVRLDGYRRAFESWAAMRPTAVQIEALLDCVAELAKIARHGVPTLRPVNE